MNKTLLIIASIVAFFLALLLMLSFHSACWLST
jgi:hypothetical protein